MSTCCRVGDRIVTWRGAGVIVAVYKSCFGVWLDSGYHVHERKGSINAKRER